MRGKKIFAVGMSAMLVAALCPAVAMAGTLESGAADATPQAKAQVAPQASATTVYVITKKTSKTGSSSETTSFKYNSEKLVSKRTVKSDVKSNNTVTTWAYDKSNTIKKITLNGLPMTFKSKNGKWTSGTFAPADKTQGKAIEKYSYSGGKIKKISTQGYYYNGSKLVKSSPTTHTITYNKKGLPTHVQPEYGTAGMGVGANYEYDAQGNLKRSVTYNTVAYTNKYDKLKRLTSCTQKPVGNPTAVATTEKYTYKKVTVKNAALAKKVKAQQWAIINGPQSYALGGQTLH